MPILDSLTNLLGTWSPHSRRHHRASPPDEGQSPLAQVDGGSPEILRRSHQAWGLLFGGGGDGSSETQLDLDLGLSGSAARDGIVSSGELVDDPSYAERDSPDFPGRPRPRFPSDRGRFGMSALSTSRRTQTTDLQTEEERRLLGDYRTAPDATPINAGCMSSRKQRLQGFAQLQPQNNLSGKAKESGPVRARGKPTSRPGFQQYSRNNRSRLTNTPGYDGSERPAKRQRRDNQPAGREMNSDDEIVMEAVSSSHLSSPIQQASPNSVRGSRPKGTRRDGVDEFRQVEQSVRVNSSQGSTGSRRRQSSEDADHFTGNAARQRKSEASLTSTGRAPGSVNRDPKPEIFQSVEVPVPKEAARKAESPPLQGQFIAIDGTHRGSNVGESPESPDELQGERTVNPVASSVLQSPRKEDMRQRSSPSDIQPTHFSSRSNHRPKSGKQSLFDAVFLRFQDVELPRSGGSVTIRVNSTKGTLEVEDTGDAGNSEKVYIDSILHVVQGDKTSRKVSLQVGRFGDIVKRIDIKLSSEKEKTRLCDVLGKNVKVKDSEWMDKAFKRGRQYVNTHRDKCRSEKPSDHPLEVPRTDKSKRPKLSDRLQDDEGNTNSHRAAPRGAASPASQSIKNYFDRTSQIDLDTSGTADTYGTPQARKTRSMHRREMNEPIVCDDENEEHGAELTPDVTPGKWKKPLVYPRFGKKMAEVDAQDRERLRDGEFLNDNLIGFYIRFLEEHLGRTNKDVAKRVYFFNSYFFATITNTARGQRGINYGGVQKWTRNVNLFSYDYIVVPINEAAHWYVAIICNLPSLGGKADGSKAPGPSRSGSEAREIPESPDPTQEGKASQATQGTEQDTEQGKEEVARQSFARMSLSEDDSGANESKEGPTDEWPEHGENPASSPARFSAEKTEDVKSSQGGRASSQKRKKKKQQRQPPKDNARQPFIITFDSLDMGRTATINALRTYLCEEAKSKRGVEINSTMIKGMKARQVPLQSNYSDCGLYLLAYLEKFAQNPDEFVTKLLRKEMDGYADWPRLQSGHLRRRLRKFLDDLYDEQEEISPEQADEGTTMADRKPVSFLLGSETAPGHSGEVPGESESVPQDPDEKPGSPRDRTPQPESKDQAPTEQSPGLQEQGDQTEEVVEVPDSQDHGVTQQIPTPDEAIKGDDAVRVEIPVSGTPPPKGSGEMAQKRARG